MILSVDSLRVVLDQIFCDVLLMEDDGVVEWRSATTVTTQCQLLSIGQRSQVTQIAILHCSVDCLDLRLKRLSFAIG